MNAKKQNLFELLSDLISFETVYLSTQEFLNCVEYIREYLANSDLHIDEFKYNNATSLVISNSKSKNLDVIFCGHIDVVPAAKPLFTLKKNGDILYGRGVSDMKGQVAIMLQVMRDLPQWSPEKKVALFITSDEERGGFDGAGKLLGDLNYSSKVAIVPDGGFDYTLVSEAKGVLQIKITATGSGCHSSEPWKGTNAILKLFDIIRELSIKFPNPQNHEDWRTSFNISKIEGGDCLNKVPSSAAIYLDIRHTYLDGIDCIIDFIKSIDPTINIEILMIGDAFKLDKDSIYVEKYIDICKKTINTNVDFVKSHTASDGRFFSAKKIPCLIMNPIGGNIHSDNEWVSLSSLNKLETIYKQYIKEFIQYDLDKQ